MTRPIAVCLADAALAQQVARWLADDGIAARLLTAGQPPDGELPAAVLADAASLRTDAAALVRLRERAVPLVVVGDARSLSDRRLAARWGAVRFLGLPLERVALLRAASALAVANERPPPRILLVGPPGAVTEQPAAALTAAGFAVQVERDVRHLFAAPADHAPAAVVLLADVAGVSVPELAALLRADAAFDDVALLAVLAEPGQARLLPATCGFLVAPLAGADLLQALRDGVRHGPAAVDGEVARRLLDARAQERLALDAHVQLSVADAQGDIVYVNEAFCRMSGYRREELLGRNHRLLKSGRHGAAFYEEIWRTIGAGRIWQGELCNRRRDGELYWVKMTIAPQWSADGQARQYLAIGTDITAARQTQFSLRHRVRQQWVLDGMATRLIACDPAQLRALAPTLLRVGGRLLDAQRACLYLRSADGLHLEPVGQWREGGAGAVAASAAGDVLAELADLWPRLVAGASIAVADTAAVRGDPAYRWVDAIGAGAHSLLVVPLHDGRQSIGLAVFAATGEPIHWSERNQAFAGAFARLLAAAWSRARADVLIQRSEAELTRQVERLEQMSRLADVGSWEYDAVDGRLTWSEQTYRIHALAPGTPLSLDAMIGQYAPEVRATVAEALRRALTLGEPFDYELPLQAADGTPRWVHAIGVAHGTAPHITRVSGAVQDITARKQAEQARAESDAALRDMLDAFPGLVASLDEDEVYEYANAAFVEVFGLTTADLVGHPQRSLLDPARYEQMRALRAQIVATGRPVAVERSILQRASGERRHYAIVHFATGGSGGIRRRFFQIGVDITERRLAEERLAAREAELRALLDAFPGWVARVDADLRYSYANDAFLRVLGRPREQVLGATVGEIVGAEREAEIRAFLPRVLGGEVLMRERRYIDPAGEPHVVQAHFVGAPDAERPGRRLHYAIGVEVTELRRQQRQLEATIEQLNAENRFQAMVAAIAADFAAVGRAGLDETIDTALRRTGEFFAVDRTHLFRFAPDLATATITNEWCRAGVPSRKAALQQFPVVEAPWYRRRIVDERAIVHIPDVAELPPEAAREKRLLEALGVRSTLSVPVCTARRVHGFIGFNALRDRAHWTDSQIDGLSVLAQIIANAFDRLDAEEALRALKDRAEAASAAKTEFLSSMSHELRTPMNAVLGFGQLLQLELPAGSRQRGYIDEILKGGQHLLALIDDVLDLARIESGRVQLSVEPIGMAELIDDCLRLVGPLAQRRGIDIAVQPMAALALRADRVRLRQVLLNLLSNAIKYNVDGGRVEIGAETRDDGRVRIAVADSGPGIAAERQHELFQPFNRLGAEHGPVHGTGIGLVIVRRLVEMMGGQVGVVSRPGAGSTFWFELPADERGAPPAAGAPADTGTALAGRRVLYIDDNPSNLRLVEQIMARFPAVELLTAQEPLLGVELAEAHRPDLVLLDIQMEPLDGYGVLRRLRSRPALREVPVVAITAEATPRDVERALAAGFAQCVAKPFDVAQLIAAVEQHLGQSATGEREPR